MAESTPISIPRVLIIEDETMVSMLLEDMLDELGYRSAGSIARLDGAAATVSDSACDAVILDVNLNGETTLDLAELLQKQRIPFVFSTGYGNDGQFDRFHGVPILQKPFQIADLAQALEAALGRGPAAPHSAVKS